MDHAFSEDPPRCVPEQRAGARVPVRGVAVVRGRRGAVVAEVVDISEHGVCLTLPDALEVGETYRLDIEIRGEKSRSKSVVSRVCFCVQGQTGFRVGLNCSLAEFLADDP